MRRLSGRPCSPRGRSAPRRTSISMGRLDRLHGVRSGSLYSRLKVLRKETDDNAQLATLSVSRLPGVDTEGTPALEWPEMRLTPIC